MYTRKKTAYDFDVYKAGSLKLVDISEKLNIHLLFIALSSCLI